MLPDDQKVKCKAHYLINDSDFWEANVDESKAPKEPMLRITGSSSDTTAQIRTSTEAALKARWQETIEEHADKRAEKRKAVAEAKKAAAASSKRSKK